ncbi:MAG: transposase [Candidatus Sumerlaeia bacterium]|nr:transposase [Candidatus Sumerlaeia bacterium]
MEKSYHRRSIRLKHFDYTNSGAYFITICTQHRAALFGEVNDTLMQTSDAGKMVEKTWCEIPLFYPGIEIDTFVVMPDHIHGILLVGAALCGRPDDDPSAHCGRPDDDPSAPCGRPDDDPNKQGQPQGVSPTRLSVGNLVQRFKTLTTTRYIEGVHQSHWPAFHGKVWQRNYFEHIIRNEKSYRLIQQYILDNPRRWSHAQSAINPPPEPS